MDYFSTGDKIQHKYNAVDGAKISGTVIKVFGRKSITARILRDDYFIEKSKINTNVRLTCWVSQKPDRWIKIND